MKLAVPASNMTPVGIGFYHISPLLFFDMELDASSPMYPTVQMK